ncbi:hypothetical protein NBRC116587_39070 [Pseudoteredinibacter isoporae]
MTIDNEFELVKQWIAGRQENGQGDPELETLLLDAYQNGEHKISNGCNFVNELRWPWPRHPACVVHDRLYRLKAGRSYADRMMRRLNGYFGRPGRGWVRWLGVRIGGWWIYNQI